MWTELNVGLDLLNYLHAFWFGRVYIQLNVSAITVPHATSMRLHSAEQLSLVLQS